MSNVEKIQNIISKMESKENHIYFFAVDTKGNPLASVANMYEHAKLLAELGYNTHIIHEKEDYTKVGSWLGEEYDEISHKIVKDVILDPSDIIVVPEVYAHVMEALADHPAKKVVLSQSYSYIFELLQPGKTWNYDFKFNDVITTTKAQAEYIEKHFSNIKTNVVAPSIPAYFKKPEGLKIPVIGIMTRDHKDTMQIIKSFYLQYPMYKWVTFKDLRGIPREKFAEEVKTHCLSVWVDEPSSFGTFPLESMECGTPVLGKIPNIIPEWMITPGDGENGEVEASIKDNGIWTDNIINMPHLIAEFMRLWLEDSIPQEIYDAMDETTGTYTVEKQKAQLEEVYGGMLTERIEQFNKALENEKSKEDE